MLIWNQSFDDCTTLCRRIRTAPAWCVHTPTLVAGWQLKKLGELIDMEKIRSNAEGRETLHLRLAGLDTGTNHFLHVVVVHQLSVKYRKY
jgi:hypothetical protein